METCKECIHSSVCPPYNTPNDEYPNIGDCPHFKDKADLVEVVRCKDCDNLEVGKNSQYCTEHSDGWGDNLVYVEDDDYCSFGIRKGGAE